MLKRVISNRKLRTNENPFVIWSCEVEEAGFINKNRKISILARLVHFGFLESHPELEKSEFNGGNGDYRLTNFGWHIRNFTNRRCKSLFWKSVKSASTCTSGRVVNDFMACLGLLGFVYFEENVNLKLFSIIFKTRISQEEDKLIYISRARC